MGISFGPIPTAHTDAEARGALLMQGFAFGPAITNEAAAGIGRFMLSGFGEGEVFDDYVDPPTPVSGSGVFYLSGQAIGSVGIGGEASHTSFRVRGMAFGSGIAAATGGFRLIGGGSEVAPVTQYGFAVEQEPLAVGYGNIDFGYVRESVALGAEQRPLPTVVLRDLAALIVERGAIYDGRSLVDDAVVIGERATWLAFGVIDDLAIFSIDSEADYLAIGRALERLILSGEVRNVAEAILALEDALVLRALVDAFHHGVAVDTLLTGTFIASLYHAFAQALDRMLLSVAADSTYSITALVDERVFFSANLASQADAIAMIRDAVGFAMSLAIDDGQYIAWVMNTESKGLTRYTQYPHNSFGKIGGRYVGCAADGLHWLDADDDNGEDIHAVIRTGLDALGTRRAKRLPEAFIGYTSDGTLLLRVIQTGEQSGRLEEAIYRLPVRPAESKRENRFKVGKGLKAVDFAFVIENVDGADFDLSSIEFRPIYLARRTRG